MEGFTKKSFTSPRSLTYTYYDSAPTKPIDPSKPTLLFLHGFPDNARLWKKVLPYFNRLSNRVVVPDLLGYGASSKPSAASAYNSRDSSADLAALLANESITANVVAIGHDWGSWAAQRLWLWHGARLLCGLALLNVPYMLPPSAPGGPPRFDLAAANDAAEAATGFPRLAYWELFTAPDGAAVLESHLERFWAVLHGAPEGWMRDMFCVKGGMRAFLEGSREVELMEYAKPGRGWREEWLEEVREGGGGLEGAVGLYKAMVWNHQYDVEKDLPAESAKVTVPVFYLGCERDAVCMPESVEESKKSGLVPDLTVKVIDSGHWCTMEKPDEVGEALYDWISKRF